MRLKYEYKYYEVGIITGDKSINPILSLLISGKDDGKVSVEKAKLMGMKDFLVVPKAHPFIMNDKNVMKQVAYFIANGKFDKDLNRTNQLSRRREVRNSR